MACHEEVLEAAISIIKTRGVNEFTPSEVIQYLKKQNTIYKENTIRTHITTGRCSINAPLHHAKGYKYFKRIGHGLYKVIGY